jgi:hypothetical protein
MKYEYIRIDMMRVVITNIDEDSTTALTYLQQSNDCEYREDYQCFFVLKGSPTHSWVALRYPDLLK